MCAPIAADWENGTERNVSGARARERFMNDTIMQLLSAGWKELAEGDDIKEGDVFVQDGNIYCASDFTGQYSRVHHYPHFRVTDDDLNNMYAYYTETD
jgi:hypothetical protein